MITTYCVGGCTICQGDMEIVVDTERQAICLCCNECDVEWPTVEDYINATNGTREHRGLVRAATKEEIKAAGWEGHIKYEIKDSL